MSEPTEPSETSHKELIVLTALEARVLGSLVEKAATTPETYPLTVNATHLACNQKTNRDPVMHADLGDVGHALRTLEEKNLARAAPGARAVRYEHTIDAALNVTVRARAVIALLLLRGAQTHAELFARSERLADFPDSAILGDTLERLMSREPALIVRIGRAAGQREDRYMHLLCGPVSMERAPAPRDERSIDSIQDSDLETRVQSLERALEELQNRLDALNPER